MDIVNYVIRSIVTNRVVYLKESMEGLKLFGVAGAIRSNPQAFQSLFTKDSQSEHVIDANYLVLVLRPDYSPRGSSRRLVEESLMDSFQDFCVALKTTKTSMAFLRLWPAMKTTNSAVLSQRSGFPLLI